MGKRAAKATAQYDMPVLGGARDYGYGHTTTVDGRAVQVWIGNDLITTLCRYAGRIVSLLPCPGGAVRLD